MIKYVSVNSVMIVLLFGVVLITACRDLGAQVQNTKPEVLLLGVYHFNNPGMDTHNMSIDDYLSDHRQKEIEEVVSRLADFRPTKILVEFTSENQPKLDSLYGLYQNGQVRLNEIPRSRNEVYQLGFRLAKQMNIAAPIAIDYPGFWLGNYADFIADTLEYSKYLEQHKMQAMQVAKQSEVFKKNTVRENLLTINSWEWIITNHDYYNNVAIDVRDEKGVMFNYQEMETEIDDQPYFMRSFDFNNIGIELVAEWYKRNLFIYRNLLDQTEQGDRILVIYGGGHIRYLHQLLSDNPDVVLVKPQNYLK